MRRIEAHNPENVMTITLLKNLLPGLFIQNDETARKSNKPA